MSENVDFRGMNVTEPYCCINVLLIKNYSIAICLLPHSTANLPDISQTYEGHQQALHYRKSRGRVEHIASTLHIHCMARNTDSNFAYLKIKATDHL